MFITVCIKLLYTSVVHLFRINLYGTQILLVVKFSRNTTFCTELIYTIEISVQ
jgi:hypothetical protein